MQNKASILWSNWFIIKITILDYYFKLSGIVKIKKLNKSFITLECLLSTLSVKFNIFSDRHIKFRVSRVSLKVYLR